MHFHYHIGVLNLIVFYDDHNDDRLGLQSHLVFTIATYFFI